MGLENAAASNALATMGAVCWGLQLVPQIWKSWRRKDTQGLSTSMLAVWFVSGLFLGSYCITSDLSIPLIIQPQAFCFFSSIAWAQCLHYHSKWTTSRAVTVVFVSWAVGAGIELALVFGCKHLQRRGNERMNLALGILAAIFVAGGLLPQYYEVAKYRAVIGISLVFLFIDLCGGVFSALSLAFSPPPFDVLASVSYGCVVVLEVGIFLLVPVLNPRYYRRRRKQEQEQEQEQQQQREKSEDEDDQEVTVGTEPASVATTTTTATKDGDETVDPAETPLGWMGRSLEGFGRGGTVS
ncbi:hypothetical protein JCM11491_005091 [Sporobolomyces phaffii]